ncbi:MAG: hypothetical protein WC423_27205 [Vulcanimicrobiota bacterium]
MKKRYYFALVLVLVLIVVSSLISQQRGSVYQVSIDGLSIGMTEEEVLSIKGEETSRVLFDEERRVKAIYSYRPLTLNRAEEIRVGTPWKELRARLGWPDRVFCGDDSKKAHKDLHQRLYVYRELGLGVFCQRGVVHHFEISKSFTTTENRNGGRGGWYVW